MLRLLLITGAFLIAIEARADVTIDNLHATAAAIKAKLDVTAQSFTRYGSNTVDQAGHQGRIVVTGISDYALINNTMVTNYNNAVQTVISANYQNAQEIFIEKHEKAIDDMHTSIDELVGATSKLSTVAVVAELAINADTTQEQLQVQQALVQTDMTITETDVNAYNTAVVNVETYSQQAGAFLAAAQDTSITSAVDNYSAQNNIAVASYSAIQYTQDIDTFVISYDNNLYMSFQGFFTDKMITADELYANTSYTQ
tara:strand:+ start:1235 stop:2002 length:768 start_codon:yes stop_codon:yes gene_type:complete